MPQVSSEGPLKPEKLSFAKIAASGLSSAPRKVRHLSTDLRDTTHPPHGIIPNFIAEDVSIDEPEPVTPGVQQTPPIPTTAFDPLRKPQFFPGGHVREGLRVDYAHRIMPVQYFPRVPGAATASSNGSVKPPSLDGKSVTSGTTFAMDEKESLRPDDSASVNAVEDEEAFAPAIDRISATRLDPPDGLHAFRQQFRDISLLEPANGQERDIEFAFGQHVSTGVLYVPPQGPGIGVVPGPSRHEELAISNGSLQPDPKLLEALESPRDRIWVLKLEQDIFDFVKDTKETSLNLPQCNAYHRMLAHKIADYYMLGHVVDDSVSAVKLFKTPHSRLPPPLTAITTPSTAASTPPPTAPLMKILRRGDSTGVAGSSTVTSKTTSENDESGNEDDKKKVPASREEREARYEAARLRIMGSAKPSEVVEPVKEKEDSRASSAAGKKSNKKKARSDSEDGFEARSAYSAYYTSGYSNNNANPYAGHGPNMQAYVDPSHAHPPASAYVSQMSPVTYPQYAPQHITSAPWLVPTMMGQPESMGWSNIPSPGYEMPQDFGRAGSGQAPSMARHNSAHGIQPGAMSSYSPVQLQYGANYPQTWSVPPQPAYPTTPTGSNPHFRNNYSPQQGYRPSSSSSGMMSDAHAYQYGQLPSEAFPGRPASKLEHPLPGSYKGKHFNPQSQAFIPTQSSGPSMTPKGALSPVSHGAPGLASPLQRPLHAHPGPGSSYGSHPQSTSPALAQHSVPPMIHPLPQPVFPRQAAPPSLPLPPKPDGPLPHMRTLDATQMPPFNPTSSISMTSTSVAAAAAGSTNLNQSLIAKWGAPASLPAKPPPPSSEPFDVTRYPSLVRSPQSNMVVPSRLPSIHGGFTVVGAGSDASSVKHA